ncbi:MAG: hypothetical protein Q9162_002719 [Coniocarpon cinnabarinum]
MRRSVEKNKRSKESTQDRSERSSRRPKDDGDDWQHDGSDTVSHRKYGKFVWSRYRGNHPEDDYEGYYSKQHGWLDSFKHRPKKPFPAPNREASSSKDKSKSSKPDATSSPKQSKQPQVEASSSKRRDSRPSKNSTRHSEEPAQTATRRSSLEDEQPSSHVSEKELPLNERWTFDKRDQVFQHPQFGDFVQAQHPDTGEWDFYNDKYGWLHDFEHHPPFKSAEEKPLHKQWVRKDDHTFEHPKFGKFIWWHNKEEGWADFFHPKHGRLIDHPHRPPKEGEYFSDDSPYSSEVDDEASESSSTEGLSNSEWEQKEEGNVWYHPKYGPFVLAEHPQGFPDFLSETHGWLWEFPERPKTRQELEEAREAARREKGKGKAPQQEPQKTRKEQGKELWEKNYPNGKWMWVNGKTGEHDGDWLDLRSHKKLADMLREEHEKEFAAKAPRVPQVGEESEDDDSGSQPHDRSDEDVSEDKVKRPLMIEYPKELTHRIEQALAENLESALVLHKPHADHDPFDDLMDAVMAHFTWKYRNKSYVEQYKNPVECIEECIKRHGRKGVLRMSTFGEYCIKKGLAEDSEMMKALHDYDRLYTKKHKREGIDFEK